MVPSTRRLDVADLAHSGRHPSGLGWHRGSAWCPHAPVHHQGRQDHQVPVHRADDVERLADHDDGADTRRAPSRLLSSAPRSQDLTQDIRLARSGSDTITTQGGVEVLRVAQSFDPCIACSIH